MPTLEDEHFLIGCLEVYVLSNLEKRKLKKNMHQNLATRFGILTAPYLEVLLTRILLLILLIA